MGYTYDDFVTAATGAGMLEGFSKEDLELAKVNPEYGLSMVKLRQDAASATTTEQKLLAQEAQNQLRRVYTAGGTGTPASSATDGGFVFTREQELQDLTDKVINRDPFAYDQASDPVAASLRKQYLREAERSREDTLAKASAGTGGTPSSFAVTAGQQAGDYHLTKLNDQLAGREETAYQRYLTDYQKLLGDVGLLTQQKEADYGAYLEGLQQDQQKLQNAMNLYQTYAGRLTGDQIREMLTAMGYMTPGVEGYLQAMENQRAATVYRGGTGTQPTTTVEGMTLEHQQMLAEQYLNMLGVLERLQNGSPTPRLPMLGRTPMPTVSTPMTK